MKYLITYIDEDTETCKTATVLAINADRAIAEFQRVIQEHYDIVELETAV